jgi:hypothetical protein
LEERGYVDGVTPRSSAKHFTPRAAHLSMVSFACPQFANELGEPLAHQVRNAPVALERRSAAYVRPIPPS